MIKNLPSFDGNWNDIFSERIIDVSKTWWNTLRLSHATAVRDSLTVREISFPQTTRAKTCREWKFLETIEKLGMRERVNRSCVLQARSTIYIQDRAWIKGVPTVASPRVMNIYEQVQRRFHSCEISQREFVKKQTPPFRISTSTWNYLLQLCMIQLNPLTV